MFNSARLRFRAACSFALLIVLSVTLSGCTLGDNGLQQTNFSSGSGVEDFARGTGSPALTTASTIRIPGSDPAANAAGAAITVYPSSSAFTRPAATTVVGENDWRAVASR